MLQGLYYEVMQPMLMVITMTDDELLAIMRELGLGEPTQAVARNPFEDDEITRENKGTHPSVDTH